MILPWEVLSSRQVLNVPPWFEVLHEQVRLPDGAVVDDFFSIRCPDYATIVALDSQGRVLAERLYRHGSRAVTWALPAGYLEEGEAPLAGAQRELLEETGHMASRWTPLGQFTVDGNRGCGRAHLFLARDVRQVSQPQSGDLGVALLEWMPLHDMRSRILQDGIAELCTAAALGMAFIEMSRHDG